MVEIASFETEQQRDPFVPRSFKQHVITTWKRWFDADEEEEEYELEQSLIPPETSPKGMFLGYTWKEFSIYVICFYMIVSLYVISVGYSLVNHCATSECLKVETIHVHDFCGSEAGQIFFDVSTSIRFPNSHMFGLKLNDITVKLQYQSREIGQFTMSPTFSQGGKYLGGYLPIDQVVHMNMSESYFSVCDEDALADLLWSLSDQKEFVVDIEMTTYASTWAFVIPFGKQVVKKSSYSCVKYPSFQCGFNGVFSVSNESSFSTLLTGVHFQDVEDPQMLIDVSSQWNIKLVDTLPVISIGAMPTLGNLSIFYSWEPISFSDKDSLIQNRDIMRLSVDIETRLAHSSKTKDIAIFVSSVFKKQDLNHNTRELIARLVTNSSYLYVWSEDPGDCLFQRIARKMGPIQTQLLAFKSNQSSSSSIESAVIQKMLSESNVAKMDIMVQLSPPFTLSGKIPPVSVDVYAGPIKILRVNTDSTESLKQLPVHVSSIDMTDAINNYLMNQQDISIRGFESSGSLLSEVISLLVIPVDKQKDQVIDSNIKVAVDSTGNDISIDLSFVNVLSPSSFQLNVSQEWTVGDPLFMWLDDYEADHVNTYVKVNQLASYSNGSVAVFQFHSTMKDSGLEFGRMLSDLRTGQFQGGIHIQKQGCIDIYLDLSRIKSYSSSNSIVMMVTSTLEYFETIEPMDLSFETIDSVRLVAPVLFNYVIPRSIFELESFPKVEAAFSHGYISFEPMSFTENSMDSKVSLIATAQKPKRSNNMLGSILGIFINIALNETSSGSKLFNTLNFIVHDQGFSCETLTNSLFESSWMKLHFIVPAFNAGILVSNELVATFFTLKPMDLLESAVTMIGFNVTRSLPLDKLLSSGFAVVDDGLLRIQIAPIGSSAAKDSYIGVDVIGGRKDGIPTTDLELPCIVPALCSRFVDEDVTLEYDLLFYFDSNLQFTILAPPLSASISGIDTLVHFSTEHINQSFNEGPVAIRATMKLLNIQLLKDSIQVVSESVQPVSFSFQFLDLVSYEVELLPEALNGNPKSLSKSEQWWFPLQSVGSFSFLNSTDDTIDFLVSIPIQNPFPFKILLNNVRGTCAMLNENRLVRVGHFDFQGAVLISSGASKVETYVSVGHEQDLCDEPNCMISLLLGQIISQSETRMVVTTEIVTRLNRTLTLSVPVIFLEDGIGNHSNTPYVPPSRYPLESRHSNTSAIAEFFKIFQSAAVNSWSSTWKTINNISNGVSMDASFQLFNPFVFPVVLESYDVSISYDDPFGVYQWYLPSYYEPQANLNLVRATSIVNANILPGSSLWTPTLTISLRDHKQEHGCRLFNAVEKIQQLCGSFPVGSMKLAVNKFKWTQHFSLYNVSLVGTNACLFRPSCIPSFTPYKVKTEWIPNGSAKISGAMEFKLTSGERGEVGAIWHPYRFPILKGFRAHWKFSINDIAVLGGGEGISFVIQNYGTDALGTRCSSGICVGYTGIEGRSLGIVLYRSTTGHVELQCFVNGNTRKTVGYASSSNLNSLKFRGEMHDMLVLYSRTDRKIYVYLDDHLEVTLNVWEDALVDTGKCSNGSSTPDIDSCVDLRDRTAFVGFTASTGLARTSQQMIRNFTFSTTAPSYERTRLLGKDPYYCRAGYSCKLVIDIRDDCGAPYYGTETPSFTLVGLMPLTGWPSIKYPGIININFTTKETGLYAIESGGFHVGTVNLFK